MISREDIIRTVDSTGFDYKGIYVFGSQANGTARCDSDWDIAILRHKGFSAIELWKLYTAFVKYDLKIDIVDLYKANTVLQNEVVSHGKLIRTKDQYYCDVFENKTKTIYEDFIIMTKDLYDDIVSRGSVYG